MLVFTCGNKSRNGRLCIGVARAKTIDGGAEGYQVADKPLVEDSVGVIDPHIFQDTDGRKYLLWKEDRNDLPLSRPADERATRILIRETNAACTGWATNSAPHVLLTSDPTKDWTGWENGIVEAPWMVRRGDFYYLFYSGNGFMNGYAVGVARSERPTDGFLRCPRNPILRSNQAWRNPGHGAVVRDAFGTDWFLYHAYPADEQEEWRPQDGKPSRDWRVQLLDRISWERVIGWPMIGKDGTPTTEPQMGPARLEKQASGGRQ